MSWLRLCWMFFEYWCWKVVLDWFLLLFIILVFYEYKIVMLVMFVG